MVYIIGIEYMLPVCVRCLLCLLYVIGLKKKRRGPHRFYKNTYVFAVYLILLGM